MLVVAGCGDERLTKKEYEQTVRAVYADVQQAFRRTSATPVRGLPSRIGAAERTLRAAADELDDSRPPEAVEFQNGRLIEAMRDYADDLAALRDRAAGPEGARAVEEFNARIGENAAVKRIAEAAEQMKLEGYDLGPIAQE